MSNHTNGASLMHSKYCGKNGMVCLVYHTDGICPDVRDCEACKAEKGHSAPSYSYNGCPPHNMIPYTQTGAWGASVPPPNMKCTKCLITDRF